MAIGNGKKDINFNITQRKLFKTYFQIIFITDTNTTNTIKLIIYNNQENNNEQYKINSVILRSHSTLWCILQALYFKFEDEIQIQIQFYTKESIENTFEKVVCYGLFRDRPTHPLVC